MITADRLSTILPEKTEKTGPLHKLAARGIGTPQNIFDLLHNTISDFFCIKPKPKEVNLGY